MNVPKVELRNVSKTFFGARRQIKALENVSLSVEPREFVTIIGPSGSGKSTLLRVLAGLLPPTEGMVLYDGAQLTGPRQGVGFVFQKANLVRCSIVSMKSRLMDLSTCSNRSGNNLLLC